MSLSADAALARLHRRFPGCDDLSLLELVHEVLHLIAAGVAPEAAQQRCNSLADQVSDMLRGFSQTRRERHEVLVVAATRHVLDAHPSWCSRASADDVFYREIYRTYDGAFLYNPDASPRLDRVAFARRVVSAVPFKTSKHRADRFVRWLEDP